MRKTWPSFTSALLIVVAALAVSGCVIATRVPGPVFYVDRAPPIAYSEAVLASPGPGYVWIGVTTAGPGATITGIAATGRSRYAGIRRGIRAIGIATIAATIGCRDIGAKRLAADACAARQSSRRICSTFERNAMTLANKDR